MSYTSNPRVAGHQQPHTRVCECVFEGERERVNDLVSNFSHMYIPVYM